MRPRPKEDLERILARIDGRGYKAYQDLRGEFDLGLFRLHIEHVQADPFAPPSRIRVTLALEDSGFRDEAEGPPARRLGLEDFLGRRLECEAARRDRRGFRVDRFGQEVIWRTVVRLSAAHLEARMGVELPAAGRRILGGEAGRLLLRDLPRIVERSLLRSNQDLAALERHQDTVEDHSSLVRLLEEKGWIAFVANGSHLARRAGGDDRPLVPGAGTRVVPFTTPDSLEADASLPHAGTVRGMAIPPGVTLLVGGGFHGKSTLLDAIALGIYPHVPGDGRELVAAWPTAVKIRAEDGRAVTGTDISPFIDGLPFGASTRSFTTQNASGSTSQAANIMEALEAGARLLLIDEDSSATNFMIRDEPMRRLLRSGQEPITPFLERVRELHRARGVSTILVIGGSGEYFRVADRVILMDHYRPSDVTGRSREIIQAIDRATGRFPGFDPVETPTPFDSSGRRRLVASGYGRGPRVKVKAVGTRRIVLDGEELDLESCEQIMSPAQVRTLAEALARILEGGGRDLPPASRGFDIPGLIEAWRGVMEEGGLDRISRFPRPDLAAVRGIELAAALNRLRRLRVQGA